MPEQKITDGTQNLCSVSDEIGNDREEDQSVDDMATAAADKMPTIDK